jgi:hypothetical protein
VNIFVRFAIKLASEYQKVGVKKFFPASCLIFQGFFRITGVLMKSSFFSRKSKIFSKLDQKLDLEKFSWKVGLGRIICPSVTRTVIAGWQSRAQGLKCVGKNFWKKKWTRVWLTKMRWQKFFKKKVNKGVVRKACA